MILLEKVLFLRNLICSIIIFVPDVTMIILECFFDKLTGATVKLSILSPLPENNHITLANAPGSSFTNTEIVCFFF